MIDIHGRKLGGLVEMRNLVLKGLLKDTLIEMQNKGLKMFRFVQEPEHVLFIPTGYIVVDRAVKGPLIFGARSPPTLYGI